MLQIDRYISKSEKFFLRCWTLERHNNDLCNQAKNFFFLSGFCIFFTAKCIVLNLKSNRIKETISLTTFPEHTTSESIYMVSWIILFISMLVCFACNIIYIIFIFLKNRGGSQDLMISDWIHLPHEISTRMESR